MVKSGIVEFLLASEPWSSYRTRLDLLGEAADSPAVSADRLRMMTSAPVTRLLSEVATWPGPVLERHDKATLLMHEFAHLAEIGVDRSDPGMAEVAELALMRMSAEGPPRVMVNIARAFGGTGVDTLTWLICDAPVTLYALARMGWRDDPRVRGGVEALASLVRETGWPCAGAPSIGKFHGPGSRTDPCPVVNMLMLRLLSQYDGFAPEKWAGIDCLLELWEHSRERAPYMFRMGTDFRKLKAPTFWYGLLGVADVLSRYPEAIADRRFQSMAEVVAAKAGSDGLFVPESVYLAWKDWDFGQKKAPSSWVTFVATRILDRAGMV
jgi:hypothetical protein